MKYIKNFDSWGIELELPILGPNDNLTIGDYIIIDADIDDIGKIFNISVAISLAYNLNNVKSVQEFSEFLKSNVGKVERIYIPAGRTIGRPEEHIIIIQYDSNIPTNINNFFTNKRGFISMDYDKLKENSIIYFSKNIKDFDLILKSNKFNI